MTCHQWIRVGSFLLLSIFLAGCSTDDSVLKVEYVEGTVTLDGEPVEGATIMFSPVVRGEGAPANGFTDAQGHYELTVVQPGEGLSSQVNGGTLPGEYRVTIAKATAADTPEDVVGNAPQPKLTYHVPKRYQNPNQSGLTATVHEGNNDIPFALESK
ncbi:carboxypeptidase-like regulatory domain-containing protein [Bremerella cremea]|uniref:carboxypeptidase-like regulatory domain-containing protein n=1 Tax=Bremerella cremea TaxID=1031537 RepID=UPI0031EE8957